MRAGGRSALTAWAAVVAACAVVTLVGLPLAVDEGAAVALAYLALGLAVGVILGLCAALGVLATQQAVRLVRWAGLDGAQPATAVHAAGLAAAVFLGGAGWTGGVFMARFREPALTGLLAALASLGWLVIAALVFAGVYGALRGRRLARLAAHADPLRAPRPALAVWIGLAWLAALALLVMWPRFALVFPLRPAAAATLAILLLLEGRRLPGLLFEGDRLRRGAALASGALALLTAVTLVGIDSPPARRVAVAQPTLALGVDLVHAASDLDGDGYGWLLGGGDCAPLDGARHPGAVDVPGDGIDQNCAGGDFVPGARPSPLPDMPLPAALAREYDILLVTIDTLRYDHTGAGGYRRPTTPSLDALAERGAWFTRYYSTGSLTKDVLPTLVASRHMDELPLGERIGTGARQFPRRLGDVASFAEVLAAAGRDTALFSAHAYFDGWGIEQGMDLHVNLPQPSEPYATAPLLTDRAMAWIAGRDRPWLAWVHYYEPHYPYVTHPGSPAFGSGDIDRYDAEIRFVDEQLGRWLAWLDETPARRARTIVVVTSDHGEQLGERGKFGHGSALWEYLIHVPLLVVLPGAMPRRVETPASPIDLGPTLAALVGVAPDSSWTGRAHVAEIAHGRDRPERVVFAAEVHTRTYAAITAGFKLLRDEYRNTFQLVDLVADRAETGDAARDHPDVAARLRRALGDWRERILGAEYLAQ